MLPQSRLALVLNLGELFRTAGQYTMAASSEASAVPRIATVGIVDDSEMVRDVLVMLVRRAGYRVVEAINGKDAIERFTRDPPDVIVTDLEMPVLDGFGLLQEVRRSAALQGIPVVVFTTRASEAFKRRALELGADAYLVKLEVHEGDILKTIARLVAAGEARR